MRVCGQWPDGGNLARMWVVVPKPGMDRQLEEAMKTHNKWRQENGESWHWNTYHPVTGEHLGGG